MSEKLLPECIRSPEHVIAALPRDHRLILTVQAVLEIAENGGSPAACVRRDFEAFKDLPQHKALQAIEWAQGSFKH